MISSLVFGSEERHGKCIPIKAPFTIPNLFPVSTELDECGLPSWLTSHPSWRSLDHRLTLSRVEGTSRRIAMTIEGKSAQLKCFNITTNGEDGARIVLRHRQGW